MKEKISISVSEKIIKDLRQTREDSGVSVSTQIELLLRKHHKPLNKAVVRNE